MSEPRETIGVRLNGELKTLQRTTTVAELLAELGITARMVAVERNRHLVRKSDYGSTRLEDGDTLEVVTFVGGG
jgi:thiamine biosynthesis protein ThiS